MSSTAVPATRRFGRVAVWSRRHWVSLTLVLVSLVYGGAVTILHEDTLSPIDEVVYMDYTYKVWDQGMVHRGERFGPEVAHLVACAKVLPFGDLGQTCGSSVVNYGGLPNNGYTTGEGYTPLYFWTVRLIGDPIHALTSLSEPTSWRLSGPVWLAITMVLLVALMRRFSIPSAVTLALGLLFIASPYAWWTYTYISTDASVVAFGAALLLVVVQARAGRWSAWWLVPLGVLAPLFKITNLIAFGLVALYVLIDEASRRVGRQNSTRPRSTLRRFSLPFGLSFILAAGIQFAWMRLIPVLAVSDHIVDQGVAKPLTPVEVLRLATLGISGAITHNPYAARSAGEFVGLVYLPLSWLMIAFVLGAMMSLRWDRDRGPVVWATGLACVLALPALGVIMTVLAGVYFPLPGRYTAALIPATLLLGGMILRNRVFTGVVAAYAGALLAAGVVLAAHIGATY